MPERGRSKLRMCEGKIEGRTSSTASGLCLHIGLDSAAALRGRAATEVNCLSVFAVLRRSLPHARWSAHATRS